MKRTMRKNLLRTIRKSLGRYIAIMAIIALGSGIFVGLLSSKTDMIATGLQYMDRQNMFDLRLLSNYGWSDQEAEEAAKLPGVQQAEPTRMMDVLGKLEIREKEDVYQVYALPDQINQLKLMSGRMPERPDECLIDERMMPKSILGTTFQITVHNDADTLERFEKDTYTIVGTVRSPLFMDMTRGTSALGDGSIATFVYLPQEAFRMDFYTDLYVTLQGEEQAYTPEYDDSVEQQKEFLEPQVLALATKRYEKIRREAEEKYADGLAEYEDGLKQLEDARQELLDAEEKLREGQQEIDKNQADLLDGEKKLQDGLKQLEEKEQELRQGREKLLEEKKKVYDQLDQTERELLEQKTAIEAGLPAAKDGLKQITEGLAQIEEALPKLENGLAQINQGLPQIQTGLQTITDAIPQVESGLVQIENALPQLENGLQEIENALPQIQGGLAQIETVLPQVDGGIAQLEAAISQMGGVGTEELEQQLSQLRTQREALLSQKKELRDQQTELLNKQQELTRQRDGLLTQKTELTGKLEMLRGQKAELEKQQTELTAQKQEVEKQYQELTGKKKELLSKKQEVEKQVFAMETGFPQIISGLAQVESGRQQADTQFAEAESQLHDGEAQLREAKNTLEEKSRDLQEGKQALADAQKELNEGKTEYQDSKPEADQKIADAQKDLDQAKIDLADARKQIDDMEEPKVYLLGRGTNMGYVALENNSDIVQGVSRVFPAFFLLVAALVCITTMTRMVEEERTQIGTMKALGYGNGSIISKYLIYAGSAAVLGCGMGVLVGSVVFPNIIWSAYKIMMSLEPKLIIELNVPLCIVVVASYTAVILLVTWYTCRKSLREVPAELIRPKPPTSGKKIFLEYLPFWNKVSFLNKVTWRNIFRYHQRLLMMLVGIGGCTALLMTGFGIGDSIQDIVSYQFSEVTQYDIQVQFNQGGNEQQQNIFREAMAEDMENVQFAYQASVDIMRDNRSKSLYMIASDENIEKVFSFHKGDEKLPAPGPGEALLSVGFAETMGIEVGDTVTAHSRDMKDVQVKITGIYDNNVHNYLIVHKDTLKQQWQESPEPQLAYIQVADGKDVHQVGAKAANQEGVTAVMITQDVADQVNSMLDAMDMIVVTVVICAGILAIIVLYNLTNINITERLREIATIKVLGFRPGETASYVFKENLLLSVMGCALGLGFGRLLLNFVMSQIKIDAVWFQPLLQPISLVWSVLITMLMAVFVDFILYFRLDKINMAEALKSVE